MRILPPARVAREMSGRRRRGAALLEVLLALALFVAAAAVVTVALNASLESLERQKLSVHAVNLASSVLAEIQLGARPAGGEGPRPFEPPFQDWTWAATSTPVESGSEVSAGLQRVEVVVRHQTVPVVQRLVQVLPVRAAAEGAALSASVTAGSGSP